MAAKLLLIFSTISIWNKIQKFTKKSQKFTKNSKFEYIYDENTFNYVPCYQEFFPLPAH
jgi:hypothetical protein